MLLTAAKVGRPARVLFTVPLHTVRAGEWVELWHSRLAAWLPGRRGRRWSSTRRAFHGANLSCLRGVRGRRPIEEKTTSTKDDDGDIDGAEDTELVGFLEKTVLALDVRI